MLEQFNELPKQSDLKSSLIPFQSHRMHLGTFTEVRRREWCRLKSDRMNFVEFFNWFTRSNTGEFRFDR